MTIIETTQELIEAVAYAALARRKAENELEKAQQDGLKHRIIRQKMIAASEADRYLRKLTEILAQSNGVRNDG